MTILRKLLFLLIIFSWPAMAQTQRVVDVPTRAGVTQRFLVIAPAQPKAAVILFAGGHGGVQLSPDGAMKDLRGNFLVRSRDLFVAQDLLVAVIDAPSDRQSNPFLSGFRQTAEHVTDVKAVIAWIKQEAKIPVWLIGTSRGTQSAAYIATQSAPADGGPDGVVLTSSILTENRGGRAVPDMALQRIAVPVLVAHHRQDGCRLCKFDDMPGLTNKLAHLQKTALLVFEGGNDVGDPCEARAYHGYNGIEREVVTKISAWILANG